MVDDIMLRHFDIDEIFRLDDIVFHQKIDRHTLSSFDDVIHTDHFFFEDTDRYWFQNKVSSIDGITINGILSHLSNDDERNTLISLPDFLTGKKTRFAWQIDIYEYQIILTMVLA